MPSAAQQVTGEGITLMQPPSVLGKRTRALHNSSERRGLRHVCLIQYLSAVSLTASLQSSASSEAPALTAVAGLIVPTYSRESRVELHGI